MKVNKYVLCTKNDEQTFLLGTQLAKLNFKIVCLVGDLGSGKTVLSKGYAKGLGINEYITSPTFNIINRYEKENIVLNHMDAYRVESEDMLYDLGFEELFDNSNYVIIEWANNIKNSIPNKAIWIEIKKDEVDLNIRYFVINCNKSQMVNLGNIRV